MKAKKKLGVKDIGAPAIRVARGEVEIDERNEEDANGKVVGQRSGHVVGLRRYLARGEITERQFRAGQRFIDGWELITQGGLRAQDLTSHDGGAPTSSSDGRIVAMLHGAEASVAEARSMKRAVAKLGPCYALVADVLLAMGQPQAWAERRGYPRAGGFAILLLGLDTLAEFYEIP